MEVTGRGGRTRTRDLRFWRPDGPCAVRPICGPMRCAPRPQVPGERVSPAPLVLAPSPRSQTPHADRHHRRRPDGRRLHHLRSVR